MRLALTNCNVIDCVTPEAKTGAAVMIEDGRIVIVMPFTQERSKYEMVLQIL